MRFSGGAGIFARRRLSGGVFWSLLRLASSQTPAFSPMSLTLGKSEGNGLQEYYPLDKTIEIGYVLMGELTDGANFI